MLAMFVLCLHCHHRIASHQGREGINPSRLCPGHPAQTNSTSPLPKKLWRMRTERASLPHGCVWPPTKRFLDASSPQSELCLRSLQILWMPHRKYGMLKQSAYETPCVGAWHIACGASQLSQCRCERECWVRGTMLHVPACIARHGPL